MDRVTWADATVIARLQEHAIAPSGTSYPRGVNQALALEEVIWEGRPTWKAWAGTWIAGWVFLPILVGGFLLLSVWIQMRSKRWKLTSRRIEIESGLLARRVDTLELWRVRDVEFRQSLMDRLAGVSSISVTAHDGSYPVLNVRGLPADRAIYDRLMNAVMQARQQRGVLNVSP
jgi:membrane protein YdbS with pleckstrin-like domain